MNRIINKIILLMIISSIGIATASTDSLITNVFAEQYKDTNNNINIRVSVTTNSAGQFGIRIDNYDVDLFTVNNAETIIKEFDKIVYFRDNIKTMQYFNDNKEVLYEICVYNLVNIKDYKCSYIKLINIEHSIINEESSISNTEKVYDNEAPFIKSVVISSRTPPPGMNILVTVEAEDNIAVTKVMADEITLTKDANNNIWKGVLRVKEGTNIVFIIAQDKVGNSATSQSISYTTMEYVPSSYDDGNMNYDKDTSENNDMPFTKINKIPKQDNIPIAENIDIIENVKTKIINIFKMFW